MENWSNAKNCSSGSKIVYSSFAAYRGCHITKVKWDYFYFLEDSMLGNILST